MNRSKKTPNIVKAIILCFVLFLVGGKILGAIYPASDPNSEECPRILIYALLFFPPFIAVKCFPLQIKNSFWRITYKICKAVLIWICSIGALVEIESAIFKEDTPYIADLIVVFIPVLLIYLFEKRSIDSFFSNALHPKRRNPSILPAPPMQSPPPPPSPPRPKPQPRRYTLARIDAMDGHAFEHFTADLLRKLGYQKVQVTRGSGDQGVDVLAEKEGVKYAFQCKCYSSDLGNKPVQEVHAGKYIYQCHVGVVITNRYFTQGAKDAAKATGILLWDRDKLRSLIEAAS